MKEKQTDKGVLKYRMPNAIEFFEIVKVSGILSGVSNAFDLKMNIVSSLEKYIDYSDIDGVSSYEELLSDVDNMFFPLGEIADDFIAKIVELLKKKSL